MEHEGSRQDDPLTQDNHLDHGAVRNLDEASARSAEFQRDLDTLGRQLAELRGHTAALGEHLINDLQLRYNEVRLRAQAWKQATEKQLAELRESAWQRAGDTQTVYGEARERSRHAARQAWERSEPLRLGAKDVGEGLVKAWGELRSSLGKAAGRMQFQAMRKTPATDPIPEVGQRQDQTDPASGC